MKRFDVFGVVLATTFAIGATVLQPFRGLSLWALWLVDSTDRYTGWRHGGGSDAMRAAINDPNGVLPLGPWMASILGDVLGGGDSSVGVRAAGLVAVGLVVALVYRWGSELAGRMGAGVAVAALLCQPRFWAAATVPSPTIFAAAGVLLVWRAVLAARDDWTMAPVGAVATALGLASGLPAWTAALPLAWLVLVAPGSIASGMVTIRRTGVWTLALPLASVALFVLALDWLHADTGPRLARLVGFWVDRPAEPFLAAGTWWGPRRMAPWIPVLVMAATTPPALLLAAGSAAIPSSDEDRDVRQSFAAYVLWAMALPVVLRSTFHGGVDLMLFLSIAVALACAAGVRRIRATTLGVRAAHGAVATVILISAVSAVGAGGSWEGWRSPIVGGAPGAALSGYSRYPHGPVPPRLLVEATDHGARRFAVLANEWEIRPVFFRYRQMGLLPEDVDLVGVNDADAVVIALDDALPEFYGAVADWTRFAAAPDARVMTISVDGLDLFGVGLLD